jgi:putative transposase
VIRSDSLSLKRHQFTRSYDDRQSARQNIFDYIEMFYNPKRRHLYNNDMLSPVNYEKQCFERLSSV